MIKISFDFSSAEEVINYIKDISSLSSGFKNLKGIKALIERNKSKDPNLNIELFINGLCRAKVA